MVTQSSKKKGTKTSKTPVKARVTTRITKGTTAKATTKKTQAASKTAKPSKATKASVTKKAPAASRKAAVSKAVPKKTEKKSKTESRKSIEPIIPPAAKLSESQTITVGRSVHESMMPYKFEAYQPKTGEVYMSDLQLKHFREILETWKKELMKEVDNTITEMKGATVLADPNDRATQEEAFSLELRTRDRERKLIRKIEEALQQIDDKEYGYCESCGVEIGIRRLEARPTAVLCIDCKTLDEIRERTTQ